MITAKTLVLNERQSFNEQIRILDFNVRRIFELIHNRVRFGTYTSGKTNDGENIAGQYQSFTSHATPGTEFAVAHTVNSIPIGRIIMYQDKAGHLYQGPSTGTAWTSTNVYFKCDVASVTFLIFLVK